MLLIYYGGREGSGNLRFIWVNLRFVRENLRFVRENLRFVRENLRFVRENLRFVRENLRFVKGESSFCAKAFVYHYEIDLTLFMVLDTNNISPYCKSWNKFVAKYTYLKINRKFQCSLKQVSSFCLPSHKSAS